MRYNQLFDVQQVSQQEIVWSLCGVLAIFGALSYAELGTMIPLSGAECIYLLQGFSALPVFLHSWTSVIVLKP